MGGRTRKLRNAARRAGTPVAKGNAMMSVPVEASVAAPVAAPKKKKASNKK